MIKYVGNIFELDVGYLDIEYAFGEIEAPQAVGIFWLGVASKLDRGRVLVGYCASSHISLIIIKRGMTWFYGYKKYARSAVIIILLLLEFQ